MPWARTLLVVLVAALLALPLAVDDEGVAAQGGPKTITFYMHNLTSSAQVGAISTMRIINTTQGTMLNFSALSAKSVQYDFYVYPILANNTRVTDNVTVHIWARRIADQGDNRAATFSMRLYDVNPSGTDVAIIASANVNYNEVLTGWREYSINAPNVAGYTVASGHSLRLYVEIDGSSGNRYQMAWGDTVYRSRVDITCGDYLEVEDVVVLDHFGVEQTSLPSDVPDRDVTFKATVTDPFGGYDVRAVWCTLTDPYDTVVVDMAPMTHASGFYNSYRSEYAYGWDYTGFPPGMYTLQVDAVDNTGWYYRYPTNPGDETFGGHIESMTTVFWIGGLPETVNVSVVDGEGAPLDGALVTMDRYSGTSDADGNLTLMIVNGTYDLLVHWQGIVVAQEQVTVAGPLDINVTADVWSPAFVVVDDALAPVDDAVVFVVHPNGTQLQGFWRTDAAGGFGLTRMAGGDYNLRVLWRGVEVFNDYVHVNSSGPYTVQTMVYTLRFVVVDNQGAPLELAQVVVSNTSTGVVADSRLTDLAGETSSRLPVGGYDIVVYWRNDLVYNGTVGYLLDASGTLTLVVRVYVIELEVVDTRAIAIDGAFVILTGSETMMVIDSGHTDADGMFTARTPGGAFDLEVYWRDILVNFTYDHQVTGDLRLTVVASVFWVDVTVLDDHDEPVEGALVTFTHSSGQGFGTETVNTAGRTTFRLPIGLYGVDVVWEGSPVYRDSYVADTGDPLDLHVDVHYLRLDLVDARDVPVGNATVEVWNATTGRYMGRQVTAGSGILTFRLPGGAYSILVTWEMSEVYRGIRPLRGSEDVTVHCAVYYTDLDVVDASGVPLAEALVELWNASSGRDMGTHLTSSSGTVAYRVPVGTYSLHISWADSPVHSSVIVVRDNIDTTITAMVYNVRFHAIDASDVDVVGAMMEVVNATTHRPFGTYLTNGTGSATLRLPLGDYQTTVTWTETVVFRRVLHIFSNDDAVLRVAVYYLSFHIVDGDGIDLPEARFVMTNSTSGKVLGAATTTSNATLGFRLPQGPVTFSVVWMSVEVNFTTAMPVVANADITVVAKVYYLTVEVKGSDGASLRGAKVVIERGASSVAAATTDGSGLVVFRLPFGAYTVNMTYRTTYYLTPIDVKRTEQVDLQQSQMLNIKLTEDEYPIPFYRTNLFAVIMAFVVTFVLLLVVFYYVLKRREDRYYRKPEEEGTEEDVEVEETGISVVAGPDVGGDEAGDEAGDEPSDEVEDGEVVEDEIDRLLRESEDEPDGGKGP